MNITDQQADDLLYALAREFKTLNPLAWAPVAGEVWEPERVALRQTVRDWYSSTRQETFR